MNILSHPPYKPGDVIIEEDPLIYSLSPESSKKYCSGCFAPEKSSTKLPSSVPKLFKCIRCRNVKYCSAECRESDWNQFHQYECPIYIKHGYNKLQDTFGRAALRCLILFTKRPEALNEQFRSIDTFKMSFKSLKGEREKMNSDFQFTMKVKNVLEFVSALPDFQFDEEEYKLMLFKYYINSHRIFNLDSERVGIGLYLGSSVFGHSCSPNAITVFKGIKLQVRAVKNIPLNEPITISYCDLILIRSERQAILKQIYDFDCLCDRCSYDWQVDDVIVIKINHLKDGIDKLLNLCDTFKSNRRWEVICKVFETMIPLIERICGKYHFELTRNYIYYLKYKIKSGQVKDFPFKKVEEAIKVTHGEDHPLSLYYNRLFDKSNFLNGFNDVLNQMSESIFKNA